MDRYSPAATSGRRSLQRPSSRVDQEMADTLRRADSRGLRSTERSSVLWAEKEKESIKTPSGSKQEPNGELVPLTGGGSKRGSVSSVVVDALRADEAKGKRGQDAWINGDMATQLVLIVIAANCLVLGLEAENRPDRDTPPGWIVSDFVFTAIFLVECGMRMYAERCDFWQTGWNWFDFMLVVLNVSEIILIRVFEAIGEEDQGILRSLSGLRLLRLGRLLRVLSGQKEFVVLVVSLVDAIRSTTWISFMICVVMAVLGIIIRRLMPVSEDLLTSGDPVLIASYDQQAAEYWGSVPVSILSLFKILTTEDWIMISDTAIVNMELTRYLFIIYLFVNSIAMLNLTTGIIVDSVMQSRTDMEEEELTRRREIEGENLRSAFNEAAGIKDELNKDQFIQFLGFATHGEMGQKLDMLEIYRDLPSDEMYLIFDRDGIGAISCDVWNRGLTRMMGTGHTQAEQLLQLQVTTAYFGHAVLGRLRSLREELDVLDEAATEEGARSRSPSPRGTTRDPPDPDMDEQEFDTVMLVIQSILEEQHRLQARVDTLIRKRMHLPPGQRTPLIRVPGNSGGRGRRSSVRSNRSTSSRRPSRANSKELHLAPDLPRIAAQNVDAGRSVPKDERNGRSSSPTTGPEIRRGTGATRSVGNLVQKWETKTRTRSFERRNSFDSDITEATKNRAMNPDNEGEHVEIAPRGVAMPSPLTMWQRGPQTPLSPVRAWRSDSGSEAESDLSSPSDAAKH